MHHVRTAAAVGGWLACALAIALITGVARAGWGWVVMGILFLVLPSQLAWQLVHRHGRVRIPVALALVAGLVVAFIAAAVTPLSTAELERVGDRFVVPVTWELERQTTSGEPLCLDACPTVEWEWSTDDKASVVAVEAVAILRSAGFRVVVREDAAAAAIDATSGRVDVDGRVEPTSSEVDGSRVRFTLTSRR